jgi:hypothetical protein
MLGDVALGRPLEDAIKYFAGGEERNHIRTTRREPFVFAWQSTLHTVNA